MADWPYNTTAWRNLRAAKLRASPVCQSCEKRGRLVLANTVDHVLAITKGGDPFPALSGLRSMCAACHNAKTNGVDKASGRGLAFPGADATGMPLDPAHPFLAEGYTPSKDQQPGGSDRRGRRFRTKFPGRR